jgi:hypothetical protein
MLVSEPDNVIARVPAVPRYAKLLYDALYELSEPSETGEYRVFNGRVTEIFNRLGISLAYYTQIRRLLIKTGSIEMLKRGGGGLASEVALHHPPPSEENLPTGLTTGRHLATLVEALGKRVEILEGVRESQGGLNIAEALRNHESRLSKLEREQDD